jgi:DNA-binding transcriptional regulator YiaG
MADETLQRSVAERAGAPGVLSPEAMAVRRLRRAYGETQEEFAHRCGVTVSTMCRWEMGHARPSKLAQRVLAQLKTLAPGPGA